MVNQKLFMEGKYLGHRLRGYLCIIPDGICASTTSQWTRSLDTTKTVQKIKQYEEHNTSSLRGNLLAQGSKTTTCYTRFTTVFTNLLKQK